MRVDCNECVWFWPWPGRTEWTTWRSDCHWWDGHYKTLSVWMWMRGTTVTNVKQLQNCIMVPAIMRHGNMCHKERYSLARLTNLYDCLEPTWCLESHMTSTSFHREYTPACVGWWPRKSLRWGLACVGWKVGDGLGNLWEMLGMLRGDLAEYARRSWLKYLSMVAVESTFQLLQIMVGNVGCGW